MKQTLQQLAQAFARLENGSRFETFWLYPGMALSFLTLERDGLSLCHDPAAQLLEIHYCRAGRVGWRMESQNTVYLGPGDYLLHTMDICAQSAMTLPNGHYEGLSLYIDLPALSQQPPPLLEGTGIDGAFLAQRFCGGQAPACFAAAEQTETIFADFYGQPEALRLPYWRLKAQELLLCLAKREAAPGEQLAAYQAEQVAIVRDVHRMLCEQLATHVTIDALARQFHINPTTLKTVFKAVYGNSIAAHMREHRMERAAALLRETPDSVAQIAQAVGYESQSKFTAAFKAYYSLPPTDYRKRHRG